MSPSYSSEPPPEGAYIDSQQAEQRYRPMFEDNPLPMFVYDLDSLNFLAVNKAAVERYGYSRSEFLRMNLRDIRPPEDIPNLVKAATQERHMVESLGIWRHQLRDGRLIDVEIHAHTIDFDGKRAQWVMPLDVTERLQMEAAATSANQRNRQLLEQLQKLSSRVPGMLYQFLLRPDGSSCMPYCSEGVRGVFGIAPEAIREDAAELFAHVHKDDLDALWVSIHESAQQLTSWKHEFRLRPQADLVRRLYGSATPERLEDGSTLWHGFINDITSQHQVESNLRAGESRLQSILNSAVDGIILIDCHGKMLSFNPAAEKIFGYTAEEVLGHNVSMLMPEPDRGAHDGYLHNYLRTGRAQIIGIGREVVALRRDGVRIPLDLSIAEWNHGQDRYFTGVVRDLSERKLMEAQLLQHQKMEALGRLAGGLAHDFNNLLGIVMGNLEFLEMTLAVDSKSLQRIQNAMSAAQRGADITRRLLRVSRMQSANPAELRPQDLGGVLKEVEELLRRTLGDNIRLVTVVEPDLPRVKLDPAELENVLINLAINARDAMPKGGNIVMVARHWDVEQAQINTKAEPREGHFVLLEISDDGEGMSAEVRERAFEPFYTTKQSKGSGMGLAMVYSFVKQCHGHIHLYSEPHMGTMFHIYLPAVDEDIHAAPAGSAMTGGTETLLVVDDEADLRHLAAAHLQDLGYQVLQAGSGEEALKLVADGVPLHLLLSDMVMPGGMDGAELAQRVRQLRPQLPIVLTSGFPQSVLDARGLSHLKYPMLRKPYRKFELALAIRQALDQPEPPPEIHSYRPPLV